jgi:hypothetical protein
VSGLPSALMRTISRRRNAKNLAKATGDHSRSQMILACPYIEAKIEIPLKGDSQVMWPIIETTLYRLHSREQIGQGLLRIAFRYANDCVGIRHTHGDMAAPEPDRKCKVENITATGAVAIEVRLKGAMQQHIASLYSKASAVASLFVTSAQNQRKIAFSMEMAVQHCVTTSVSPSHRGRAAKEAAR